MPVGSVRPPRYGTLAREDMLMADGARIANPQYLVETEWLAAHLADPDLRVFDCTTYLDPDPVTVYAARSGRPDWEQGHIPGSDHLDLQGERPSNSPRPCRGMAWATGPAWCSTASAA